MSVAGGQECKFIFYDTETTGTNIDFDQIIQFAAILTDRDFVEIDRINIRCRRLPWVIPSPGAMLITGTRPEQIDDELVPQFPEMMASIFGKLKTWTPAIFIGYNSFKFDEPLLQRALWQSLIPPYATVTNGNGRADLLPLVRAVSRIAPHALSVPNIASSRPSFRLHPLASLNGFSTQNAHDALADTQAVIHISKRIASRASKLWNLFVYRAHKVVGAELLNSNAPIYFAEPEKSGKPGWWGISIGVERRQRSTALVVRLDADWERFFSGSQSVQSGLASDQSFQVRRVKANMMPIAFTETEAFESFGISPSKKEEFSAKLLSSASRKSIAMRLVAGISPERVGPMALEQRIFDAFPGKSDELFMREFWERPWPNRTHMIRKFHDVRLRQIAQRLIFLMEPESLSKSDQTRVWLGIKERVLATHTDNSLWRTISMAQTEIDELRGTSSNKSMLDEISSWLSKLQSDFLITS